MVHFVQHDTPSKIGDAILATAKPKSNPFLGGAMGPLLTHEALLTKLVRESPIAIAASTLADGHILDVNDSFLRLFGYAKDEVIGQTSTGLGLWVDPAQRTELVGALMEGQPLRDFNA